MLSYIPTCKSPKLILFFINVIKVEKILQLLGRGVLQGALTICQNWPQVLVN